MPRVISYTRFSTKKQAAGDSSRRQADAAVAWCKKKGLELDNSLTFDDAGISGYSGANAKRGRMAALRQMAEDGRLEPGTYILVEAFDRITRLPMTDAQELLLGLVNAGMIVVTLTDGKEWTKRRLNNLEPFIMAILTLYRGHQESAYKSERLREAFKAARERGEKWKFASGPGWLYREQKGGDWKVDEELAGVVRKVFDMAVQGYGCTEISKRANQEGWPLPTRLKRSSRWNKNIPRRLLLGRAVLGEHEHKQYSEALEHEDGDGDEVVHHPGGVSTGIFVKDYYPAIIDEDTWLAARAVVREKEHGGVRRDEGYLNIWSGMLYCGHCGAPLHRRHEQRKVPLQGQLMCDAKKERFTQCKSMGIQKFDRYVLHDVLSHSIEMQKDDLVNDWPRLISAAKTKLSVIDQKQKNVLDAVEKSGGAEIFLKRAVELEAEKRTAERELQELLIRQAGVGQQTTFELGMLDGLLSHVYTPGSDESRDVRADLHLKIARVVECIWVWAYDVALVKYRGSNQLGVVALPSKTIVQRPQPYLALARQGLLMPGEEYAPGRASRGSKPVWIEGEPVQVWGMGLRFLDEKEAAKVQSELREEREKGAAVE